MNLVEATDHILQALKKEQSLEKYKNIHSQNSLDIPAFIQNQIMTYPPLYQQRLCSEFFESGPLENLIKDPSITEIIIAKNMIAIEKSGCLQVNDDIFLSDFTYQQFVHRLSEESQCHTDLKTPFKDGSWRDFRVHMIQDPICSEKSLITLRRHSGKAWSLEKLCEQEFLNEGQKKLFQQMYKDKKNLLIVGPTGVGKTTLINSLLKLSQENERLIIIEDTSELITPHRLCTKLLTRSSCSEQLSSITQQDLLKQALRMRPDRILVGEVRGSEAKDLLLTLSTGHSGFLGSLHAKSGKEALWRLEMLIQMGAPQWQIETIRKLIFFGLDAIIVVGR
ncbi:MAG: CpaF family protein, partial [Bdellovibrionales bacterium]|nr:CpaF family protein [Bdellovibrionales bacterium]